MGDTFKIKEDDKMTPLSSADETKSTTAICSDKSITTTASTATNIVTSNIPAVLNSQSSTPLQHQTVDSSLSSSPSHYGQHQSYPYNMTAMSGALAEYQNYGRRSSPSLYQPPLQQHHYAAAQSPYGQPNPFNTYVVPHYQQQYGQHPNTSYAPSYPQAPGRPTIVPSGQYQQGHIPYYYYQDSYSQAAPAASYSPSSSIQRSGPPAVISSLDNSRNYSGAYNHPSSPVIGEAGSITQASPSNQSSHLRNLEAATAAIPRGPPRKPRQSGHALWVGNLPPGSSITALKDHFSRDARDEIESLFLISKSNCAFVNYRAESACEKALNRFHDSRFQGVRLVCRLRKSSVAAPGAPTGPSASSSAKAPAKFSGSRSENVDDQEDEEEGIVEQEVIVEQQLQQQQQQQQQEDGFQNTATLIEPVAITKERFFIVKSLTLQDLDQSVKNGIWATQSHNEDTLNKAYRTAENVYLIFSANKSGEYYGYARMASPISEDATQVYGTVHRTEITESSDSPKKIPTPATEFAPKGHIIDDSARGTIFWEAEHSDDEEVIEEEIDAIDVMESEPQTWGKPFKIEWMSTTKVQFYKTRGLRNPWNSNREIKIARDGTELEPSVGNKLIQLFHQSASATVV